MSAPVVIGLAAAIISLVEGGVFAVLFMRAMDRSNSVARHIASLFAVIVVVLALAIVGRVFSLDPDHGWFAWINALAFCLVPVVIGHRLLIFLRFRRAARG